MTSDGSDGDGAAFVAIDGDLAVVGAPGHDHAGIDAGAAYIFELPQATYRRGDSNGDGAFNIADAIFTLTALFVPGSSPPACLDASDANDDGMHDLADAIYTLSTLFLPTAAQPPAPNTDCGDDPTFDALACAVAPVCP